MIAVVKEYELPYVRMGDDGWHHNTTQLTECIYTREDKISFIFI